MTTQTNNTKMKENNKYQQCFKKILGKGVTTPVL